MNTIINITIEEIRDEISMAPLFINETVVVSVTENTDSININISEL